MSSEQHPESQNEPQVTSSESLPGEATDPAWDRPEDSVDRFDADYPEELPERLQWLESHFGIDRYRILRLIGLSSKHAAAATTQSLSKIVRRFEDQAERAEHLLMHYLSWFRYETEKAVQFAHQLEERIRTGEIDLAACISFYKADASAAEREQAVLAAIVEERADLLPAMARFLFDPNLWHLPVTSPAPAEPRQVV